MKAVVTGGAGFIGSHMVDRLLAEGVETHVVDNLSTGHLDNLAHVRGNELLHFHQLDISEYDSGLEKVFEGADYIVHLAALADIVPSIVNPVGYHRSNVDGTLNVLEAARKVKGLKKLVYAASSSCYGLPDKFPTPETAEMRPMYPYAATKWLGECYCMNWHKIYKMPIVSLRFFNVYGPRSRTSGTYGAVFGVFLSQKIHGKPFTVVGDGKQTRDFTYVTDIVDAIWTAVRSDLSGEIMNVGSDNTYSVNRLVELLGGPVVHIPKRPGEPDCTQADIAKIKKLLKWKPKVAFEEGVAEMVKNIDYWKNAPVWTPDAIAEATKDWFKYLGKDGR
ncbi:MAG: SDR family oxidoreductase [Methanobacteriota archaeon]